MFKLLLVCVFIGSGSAVLQVIAVGVVVDFL